MYKHLYDNFAHWYKGGAREGADKGSIWLYSDPHFSDPDLAKYRKDITDDEQVRRINSKVGKYDTLIILGDVGNLEYVKKLRGYKVLIMGNHDAGATNYTPYFNEVYEGAWIISEKIILSHEPIDVPWALNLHGHVHDLRAKDDANHWNFCAEHINYTPINLNEVIASGKLKNITTIHRATIDNATIRKQKNGARNG